MNTTEIQARVYEIIGIEFLRLTSECAFDDLMGLYGDIRMVLSEKASNNLIDTYTEFMAKEQGLYSPEAAYEAGKEAAQMGRKYKPLEYISVVLLEPGNKSLLEERDALFDKLYALLGEAHGLIDDYNEAYRLCHGAIGRKIDRFYHLGYYGHMPNDESAEQIEPA